MENMDMKLIKKLMNISCIMIGSFFFSAFSQADTITYMHTDALGSPVAATDESGNVLWREHYSPFGAKLDNSEQSKGNDVGYTGHQFDNDTGLVYMQARYYDPVIGRFYSNDPVGYTAKNPVMSFNRYLYVNNNPYKYTDPTGESLKLLGAFISDTAVNAGLNYAESGSYNLSSAASDAAVGLINPMKKLQQVKRVYKLLKKSCCFVAGTQVLTEDGYKSIEDIKLGEKLWAKNVETGEQEWKAVTKIFNEPDRGIYEIKLLGNDGFEQKIEATDDHPFYVIGSGWKTTIELKVGDEIETDGSGAMTVVSVVDEKRQALTYNFTVADFHTYYVTKKNVLVHNCGIEMKGSGNAARIKGDPSQAVAEAGLDKAKLTCAQCKLKTSIKNRKAEQKRKGPLAGHGKKIKSEQKVLDKVNNRLKDIE